MFIEMCILFYFCGVIFITLDWYLPFPLFPMVKMMIVLTGVILIAVGNFLLIVRLYQTGAFLLVRPPKPKQVILVHQRKGKSSFLLPGKLIDLDHIYSKNKLFKDEGGSRRIAGHDVRFTNETISHTLPEVLCQWVHRMKKRYSTEDRNSLLVLHDKLKGITCYDDLNSIPELKEVLLDPEKRREIMKLDLEEIRHMGEMLYDGKIVHFEDYANFTESSAPYDMDSFVTHQFAHRQWQFKTYSQYGGMDWKTIIIPLSILLILGAIAFQIFGGG